MKFNRPERKHSNKRNFAIIGFGLLVVLSFGGYLYLTSFGPEGLSKKVILSVQNISGNETPVAISVKINGNKVFSETVAGEESRRIDINLREGSNKLELLANGTTIRQDSVAFGPAETLKLEIIYFDSAGQPWFNFHAEEILFQ